MTTRRPAAVLVREIPGVAQFMPALKKGAKYTHRPVAFFAAEVLVTGLMAIDLISSEDVRAWRAEEKKNEESGSEQVG